MNPITRTNPTQLRSPFENILNMFSISSLPLGHEKPLKYAIYNALALFLLVVCSAAGYALYLILEPFFKPLMWAFLVGSVLYPIKRRLAKHLTLWFDFLEDSKTSLFVGVATLPIQAMDHIAERFGAWLIRHVHLLISLVVALPTLHVFYYYTPMAFSCVLWKFIMLSNAVMIWLVGLFNTITVFSLGVCYLVTVALFWKPKNSEQFKWAAMCAWFVFSAYLTNIAYTFQAPLFIILQGVAAAGFIIDKRKEDQIANDHYHKILEELSGPENPEENKDSGDNETKPELKTDLIQSTPVLKLEKIDDPKSQEVLREPLHLPTVQETTLAKAPEPLESDIYFRWLFYACATLVVWKQLWMLPFLLIIVFVYSLKRIWKFFNLGDYVCALYAKCCAWLARRRTALVPPPVRGLQTLFEQAHAAAMQYSRDAVDSVSSAVVILGLLIFMSCAGLFVFMQIYAEGIALVQIGGTVINNTIVHNPELLGMLPPGVEETMDSLLDNAYQYGREGISKIVRGVLQDANTTQAQRLEAQVLALWDRAYQSWMDDTTVGHGPRVPATAVKQSWDTFVEDVYKTPELLNMNAVIDWAKQNVGTLTGVLESAWTLLRGNLELLLGVVSATTSVLLNGSSAVISWVLNTVVFLTTLFYLLSSSGSQYRPVEAVGSLIGSGATARNVGNALEGAVAGVFLATGKMTIFYGLWTWLIHNIFNVSIVYVPSVMAASLAAVPFLGTYWACFPGALELWLAQGRFWEAVMLVVFQFAPTALLDATLYNEIKGGGHPYLTGLAIAGGLWCLGPEGALLGPLLLCLLVVITDLSSEALRDSPVGPLRRLQSGSSNDHNKFYLWLIISIFTLSAGYVSAGYTRGTL